MEMRSQFFCKLCFLFKSLSWNIKYTQPLKCIVGCRGVMQRGGLVLGSPWQVPLRLRLISIFCSLKSYLVLKIKNTWLNIYIGMLYSIITCYKLTTNVYSYFQYNYNTLQIIPTTLFLVSQKFLPPAPSPTCVT